MREFGLCLKHTPEVSALKMRFLCLLPGHKMHFLGVFLKGAQPGSQQGQRAEAKVLEGHSRAQTYCSFCEPGEMDPPPSSDGFATKLFICSRNLEKKSRMGCSPSDAPSDEILRGEFASHIPKSQNPLNHVLPASRKHPEFLSHSFPQHTRGVLLKCNTYMAFHLINTFHLEID